VAVKNPSRATWGRPIASLRHAADITPGYIAEGSCREELLDLAGMMMSPTQLISVDKPVGDRDHEVLGTGSFGGIRTN
jgi:hypothetical protein